MTFVVCWILKIPYYSVVSVIVCITNVIPYFGPFIGAIPSFIIIFIFSPIKAIWFVVVILVLQQIDGNIIAPRILGNAVGLSSLWVITAVTIMGGLFGLVGMVLGIPLFSIIFTIVKDIVNNRLQKKNMPTNLSAYEGVFAFSDVKSADTPEKEDAE
jgi:predicted PurR-regulated permease PerM